MSTSGISFAPLRQRLVGLFKEPFEKLRQEINSPVASVFKDVQRKTVDSALLHIKDQTETNETLLKELCAAKLCKNLQLEKSTAKYVLKSILPGILGAEVDETLKVSELPGLKAGSGPFAHLTSPPLDYLISKIQDKLKEQGYSLMLNINDAEIDQESARSIALLIFIQKIKVLCSVEDPTLEELVNKLADHVARVN